MNFFRNWINMLIPTFYNKVLFQTRLKSFQFYFQSRFFVFCFIFHIYKTRLKKIIYQTKMSDLEIINISSDSSEVK